MYNELDDYRDDLDDFSDDNFSNFLEFSNAYRQYPQQPPYGPPPFTGGTDMGVGQHQGGPPGRPPSFTPQKSHTQIGIQAVSPGSIRPCTRRYVYIWLTNGRSFWAWLSRVDRRSASGFRWNGRYWIYFGVDLRRIDYFECY